MTPFWIYLPLAVVAFALIDMRGGRGRKNIKWIPNLVCAAVLWGICWLLEK